MAHALSRECVPVQFNDGWAKSYEVQDRKTRLQASVRSATAALRLALSFEVHPRHLRLRIHNRAEYRQELLGQHARDAHCTCDASRWRDRVRRPDTLVLLLAAVLMAAVNASHRSTELQLVVRWEAHGPTAAHSVQCLRSASTAPPWQDLAVCCSMCSYSFDVRGSAPPVVSHRADASVRVKSLDGLFCVFLCLADAYDFGACTSRHSYAALRDVSHELRWIGDRARRERIVVGLLVALQSNG